ncbi:hypothetical protein GCM10011415_05960 [Salipiger pallidus]|uniref:Outer membrane lipoprotein-sorting protein n=1 Tax=Salipiger pallidus TaxID=1775170 RepID=A0A8J2ZGU1_9RHOB|nr:hypothetical protein [Salipiger pallidus]GGG62476.1 hypothetical protein GCM10011415_05960 [Salipiger pallidus]
MRPTAEADAQPYVRAAFSRRGPGRGVLAALLLAALPAGPLSADGLTEISFEAVETDPHRAVTFEEMPGPARADGQVEGDLRFDGVTIGKRLAGQDLAERVTPEGRFDVLNGAPEMPLAVRPGPSGANLALTWHTGFGSNALVPIGPLGGEDGGARAVGGLPEGMGDGAVVLLFDSGQWRLALRLYSDHVSPGRPRGGLHLCFWDGEGRMIASEDRAAQTGTISLGWQSNVPIRAVTITTTDPGGIALDDILHQTAPTTG